MPQRLFNACMLCAMPRPDYRVQARASGWHSWRREKRLQRKAKHQRRPHEPARPQNRSRCTTTNWQAGTAISKHTRAKPGNCSELLDDVGARRDRNRLPLGTYANNPVTFGKLSSVWHHRPLQGRRIQKRAALEIGPSGVGQRHPGAWLEGFSPVCAPWSVWALAQPDPWGPKHTPPDRRRSDADALTRGLRACRGPPAAGARQKRRKEWTMTALSAWPQQPRRPCSCPRDAGSSDHPRRR